tara:strand:+ start:1356 stop:1697 length:342 start_codon:yes stop_codon:yes gene_type:complete
MAKEKIEEKEVKANTENKQSLKDIDLKDRPEKISEAHLDQLQRLIQAINAIQFNVGKLETQKHTMLHNLSVTQDRISVFQDTLTKEYGTFDVNIDDGRINWPEEKSSNIDDEK